MFRWFFPSIIRYRFLGSLLAAGTFILLFSSAISLNSNRAFRLSVTRHQIKLNGHDLEYQATAGYLTINDRQERPEANIFYTAYNLDSTHEQNRPITFVFNGGPGSASIWLHMGGFSPVKADSGTTGYKDNPYSWISFTDLVFIDPVGTGYSQPADGVSAKKFYGYHEDVRSIAGFIHTYLAIHHREGNPIFLAGESYGAVRAVGLAAYLQDSLNIQLAGLTLISPALNYRLVSFRKDNDAPYAYYLPTYALTAQYHQRLSPALQKLSPEQLLTKATIFSKGTYTKFLSSGMIASTQIIDTLNYFTGLSKELLQKVNGRLTDRQFTHALLQHKVVGTFDSRAIGTDRTVDPSEMLVRGLFTRSFQNYIDTSLAYQNPLPYHATVAVGNWNYGPEAADGYLNVSALLKQVMLKYPHLQIKVAAGYYDLATPAGTTDQVISELNLPSALKKNISVNYYHSGHMIYLNDNANARFRHNSQQFYKQTLHTSI